MSNRNSVATHLSVGMEGGSLLRNSNPTVLRTLLAVAAWATFKAQANLCGLSSLSGPSSLLVPFSQVLSAHPLGTCQCLRHSDKSNRSSFWVNGCGRKVRSIDVPAVTRKSFVTHNGGLMSVPTSAEAIGIQPCRRRDGKAACSWLALWGSALNFAFSQSQNILAYTKYIPRGRAPLSLLPLVPHFRANIFSCWIAIAYLLHYLKLLTYGRKPILPDFRWLLRSPAKCHIPCSNTNGSNMTVMSRIHGKVHPIRRWGKELC